MLYFCAVLDVSVRGLVRGLEGGGVGAGGGAGLVQGVGPGVGRPAPADVIQRVQHAVRQAVGRGGDGVVRPTEPDVADRSDRSSGARAKHLEEAAGGLG